MADATSIPTLPSTEATGALAADRVEGRVTKIIDGDTIEVSIDGEPYRLRYIGIDSPEADSAQGKRAKQANEDLVGGQTVYLEKDTSDTDPFGRLLRYVYLEDGTLVNRKLVRQGWAVAKAYPPDTKHHESFVAAQQKAQEKLIGMWVPTPAPPPTAQATATQAQATAAPAQAPTGPARVVVDLDCSQFDAPGDDNNKEEEWVCFRNQGDAPADMSAWTVRDEYGHSYTFPAFVLSPGDIVRVVTGCGSANSDLLYWCFDKSAVWNNDGDTVQLYDANATLVAEASY